MLTAGVFGTVLGDECSHAVGQVAASLALVVILLATLVFAGDRAAARIGIYWAAVAVARTAGTALGNLLAENPDLKIGLPLATLLTGCAFVAIVAARRPREALS